MAAKMLAATVTSLETIWNAQGSVNPAPRARPADLRLDRIWSAVQARLSAWSGFPAEHPDRHSAQAIESRLFPTGLDFLKLPFVAEHAQSERRLQIIEAEELREDLDRLVGASFVDELIDAHAAYGEALGITKAPGPVAPAAQLSEPLKTLSQAIVAYAVQIVAFAGLTPDNIGPAKRALLPIDHFRAAANRRSNGNKSSAEEPADLIESPLNIPLDNTPLATLAPRPPEAMSPRGPTSVGELGV